MSIATGPPVGPIIILNGLDLNDALWWHSHSLYGLLKKKFKFTPFSPKI